MILHRCNKTFEFGLWHFHGIVGVRVLNHVTDKITRHHLVVGLGENWGRGFASIYGQQKEHSGDTNLEQPAHFDELS